MENPVASSKANLRMVSTIVESTCVKENQQV